MSQHFVAIWYICLIVHICSRCLNIFLHYIEHMIMWYLSQHLSKVYLKKLFWYDKILICHRYINILLQYDIFMKLFIYDIDVATGSYNIKSIWLCDISLNIYPRCIKILFLYHIVLLCHKCFRILMQWYVFMKLFIYDIDVSTFYYNIFNIQLCDIFLNILPRSTWYLLW